MQQTSRPESYFGLELLNDFRVCCPAYCHYQGRAKVNWNHFTAPPALVHKHGVSTALGDFNPFTAGASTFSIVCCCLSVSICLATFICQLI